MITKKSVMKLREDTRATSWAAGSSISLSYILFSSPSNLFLCIQRKISPEEKQVERISWFSDHPVCSLQIDEIGYFGYVLTADGWFFRLPLGLFAIKEARTQWAKLIEEQDSSSLIQSYQQNWEQIPKLREISIMSLLSSKINNISCNIEGKKTTPGLEKYVPKFFQLILWRGNDKQEWSIIANHSGLIYFVSLQTMQIHFVLNFESLTSVQLIETQAISFLMITQSRNNNPESTQVILQKNQESSSINLLSSPSKTASLLDKKSVFHLLNCIGFYSYVSEEQGAIRLFFHSRTTGVIKVYKPGQLQNSSKHRLFLKPGKIAFIAQWKNYYIVISESSTNNTMTAGTFILEMYLKSTLSKCDKKSLEMPNFKPNFTKPLFSIPISSNPSVTVQRADQLTDKGDNIGQLTIHTSEGVFKFEFDAKYGKEHLEKQLLQDDFTIEDYLAYECFLRNHSFNVEQSLETLHLALKTAEKWDTLCLIDLHKKTKDPFRLFHEYSSISSLKTEQLLFRSLLTAYEKSEIIESTVSDGFMMNIILGAYGIRTTSPELGESPKFKCMAEILIEQTSSAEDLAKLIQKQGKRRTQDLLEYLSTIETDRLVLSQQKKLIDWSEWNAVFRERRYAELILNIVSIMNRVNGKLNASELLYAMITGYWVNQHYFSYCFFESSRSNTADSPFLKVIYTLLSQCSNSINSSLSVNFHAQLHYLIQQLSLNSLLLLLYISIRHFKIMYADRPLLSTLSIPLLLNRFYTLNLNQQSLSQLLNLTLLRTAAVSTLKTIQPENIQQSIAQILAKIRKQKAKLQSGQHPKYLFGIDAVWMLLRKIQKIFSENHEETMNHKAGVLESTDESAGPEGSSSASFADLSAGLEEAIQHIQKIVSAKVKKIILPNIVLENIIDQLPP